MSSHAGPHTISQNPHQVPTGVGTREAAFNADEGIESPQSPQNFAEDTDLQGGVKKNIARRELFSEDPSKVSTRSSGDCGDWGIEAACDGENPVPTPVGTQWGLWGPEVGTEASDRPRVYPEGWSCQPASPWRPFQPQLPPKIEDWPEPWRYAVEERAAIMEFHGGLPRDEAERLAEQRVRLEHARPALPSTDNRLSNANAEAAKLSQSSRPRRGPNRGAETRTGQLEGGVGLPRAAGGRALPDSTAHDEETTP